MLADDRHVAVERPQDDVRPGELGGGRDHEVECRASVVAVTRVCERVLNLESPLENRMIGREPADGLELLDQRVVLGSGASVVKGFECNWHAGRNLIAFAARCQAIRDIGAATAIGPAPDRAVSQVDGQWSSTIAAVKALIVTFYFPPAGGGGVQRPLKLAQYLPALGIETHVLAPDDPRWLHRDEGLRMPSQAWVHRARYIGVSGGKPSEVLAGTQGLERVATRARLQLRRLVVPDENATWALTAIPVGIRLVRQHGIDVVLSTSPPGSTHLIAAAIARATGAHWVADLRDSLVAHAHRRADTPATKAKAALHGQVARLVAARADAITCVSEAIAEETRALEPKGRVVSIPNGADFDDVAGLERRPSDRFRITHTGSFFGRRDPRPFLQALHDSELDVVARFLGDFRASDRAFAETLGLGDRLELLPFASRAESLALQRDSEALLLLIPEAGGRGKGVLSGKVFEYLAVARPVLAVVPPDGAAAELLRETGAGIVVAPDDTDAIRGALVELHGRWCEGGLDDIRLSDDWRDRLSRRTRVEELAALLRKLGPVRSRL